MAGLSRRTFLQGGIGAAAGAAALAGPFQGFLARAGAAPPPLDVVLGPIPDERDGTTVRLWLPAGFKYRSFHDTEATVTLTDGTTLPGRHDGMAAFPGPNGNVMLVRNHEVNGPTAALRPGHAVRRDGPAAGPRPSRSTFSANVESSYTSLNGTQMNCAGGLMPWGSWITCEETVNGPDVGPDFTGASNVTLAEAPRVPLRGPGRRPVEPRADHEGGAVRPRGGRLRPEHGHPLPDRGQLRLPVGLLPLHPHDQPDADGEAGQRGSAPDAGRQGEEELRPRGHASHAQASCKVAWVDIDDPDPTFPYTPGRPAPTTNNDAINYVGNQGRAKGAAYFSRLEGCVYSNGKVYFCSTQGGGSAEPGLSDTVQGWGNGSGQIWAYDTRAEVLRLVYQSPGPDTLDFPDNVTVRPGRKTLVLCEDNINDNYLRGLTPDGRLSNIALNRLVSSTGRQSLRRRVRGRHVRPQRAARSTSTSRPAGA